MRVAISGSPVTLRRMLFSLAMVSSESHWMAGSAPGGVIAATKPVTKPLDHATSLPAFERIKKLDGRWRARSTKGWEENQVFHVIAKGSAVASESAPGPNPAGSATAPL